MGRVNVPEDYISGIEFIKSLDASDIAFLCDILRSIPQGTGHDLFVETIKNSFEVDGAEDIAETVFSFGSLLIKDEYDDVENIAQDIVESFKEQAEGDFADDEIKDLKDRLSLILLNASNIKVTFNAYNLIRSYQNPVIGTSLNPDVRLTFEKDQLDKTPNAYIFFNLKLVMLKDNQSRSETFTLDIDDIKKLQAQIEKALIYHKSITNSNNGSINFIEITE